MWGVGVYVGMCVCVRVRACACMCVHVAKDPQLGTHAFGTRPSASLRWLPTTLDRVHTTAQDPVRTARNNQGGG